MDLILSSFAEFASTLSYGDMPAAAVQAAKDRLIDSLGCAIAAHDCDAAEIGRSLAGPAARPGLAGRMLTSRPTAAADAFVNTCMIRKLDLNDASKAAIRATCWARCSPWRRRSALRR